MLPEFASFGGVGGRSAGSIPNHLSEGLHKADASSQAAEALELLPGQKDFFFVLPKCYRTDSEAVAVSPWLTIETGASLVEQTFLLQT